MCGIAGFFLVDNARRPPPDRRHLERMASLVARRGPDDEGIWIADSGLVGLGFRRLAVIDTSQAGHQPMVSCSGRSIIAFNGEIYNYRELRSDLVREGIRLRSDSDTEILLEALELWGRDVLPRLNGMFAFAWYCEAEGRLLLARDHAGIKPLYVFRDPSSECFLFASQLDQMLAHPWTTNEASCDGLGLYLSLGHVPDGYSLIEGVEMLQSGAYMEVRRDGHIGTGRHFRWPIDHEPDLCGGAAVEAIKSAVTSAVRRQLRSDVPLGTFLSGGIDSPLVSAIASDIHGPGLRAFTIGTEDRALDESQDAARYAQALSLEHRIRRAHANDVVRMLEQVVEASVEPSGDYSIFPTLIVSELAASEVTVALSGDGGDELFWGYASRFASVISRASEFKWPHALRRVAGGTSRRLGREWSRATPWRTIGDWYRAKHSHNSRDWLRSVLVEPPSWPGDFKGFSFNATEPQSAAQLLRRNEYEVHLSRVLLKVDRASMFHSLEVRVPMLDLEVIDIASRVEWDTCLDLDGPVGKLPLRAILNRRVGFDTPGKQGFAVPMADWLRGPLNELFSDVVLSRKSLAGVDIRHSQLREEFARLTAGRAWGLWILLALALWEDRYLAT